MIRSMVSKSCPVRKILDSAVILYSSDAKTVHCVGFPLRLSFEAQLSEWLSSFILSTIYITYRLLVNYQHVHTINLICVTAKRQFNIQYLVVFPPLKLTFYQWLITRYITSDKSILRVWFPTETNFILRQNNFVH